MTNLPANGAINARASDELPSTPIPSGSGRVPRLSMETRAAAAIPTRRTPTPRTADAMDRNLKLLVVGGAALVLVLAVLVGSVPTKIVMSVVCLGVLQGLWRGASELVGLVVSSLVAVLLAPPIGRALEGVASAISGTTGMLNRTISIAAVGLLIVIVGTVAVSFYSKRLLRLHPAWARWNSIAGAGLGLIEGTILGMAMLWTSLALEPIAASQISDSTAVRDFAPEEEGPSPLAQGVKSFAGHVRGSALGGLAQATNPIKGSRLLSLVNDFVMISRDDDAMEHFLSTPAMQEVHALPSVERARALIADDARLTALLQDKGVSVDTLRAVVESPTLLRVLDETSVVSDLTPRADAIVTALAEAKARISNPETPPPARPRGLR